MDRVVLARELTLEDVKETVKHSELPIEVFIHGGMCVAYSGRCVLSNHMTGRDANRGGCAQSCRWKYRLFDKDVALHEEEHLFSMSSKDLMAAKFIPDLIKAGVASLKIEGIMKSAYYIATLIKTYRMSLDEVYEKGSIDESRMQWYYQELSKAENRPTGVGFYEGLPTPFGQLYGINGAGVTQEFIAYVLEYDEQDGTALLEVRNHFAAHSEVEIFGPTITTTSFVIGDLYDKEGEKVEVANKPMQILKTKLPVKAQAHAMIRKVMCKDRSNVY